LDQKNILLITIDALRSDHLECYGYWRLTAPHICSLGKEGLLFQNSYSNASFTLASFPAIMTGQYPLRGNVYYDIRDKITMAEIFSQMGYHTAAFNTNILLSEIRDYSKGFSHFETLANQSEEQIAKLYAKPETAERSNLLRRIIVNLIKKIEPLDNLIYTMIRDVIEIPYATGEEVTSRFLEWLGSRKNRGPFFAWIHYMDVHSPYFSYGDPRCSRYSKWITKYKETKFLDLAKKALERGGKIPQSKMNALKKFFWDIYDDRILYVDKQIGKIVKFLKSKELDKDTIIVVTADHGEAFHDRPGVIGHLAYLYEEVLRVPLILKIPKIAPRKVGYLAQSVDILPTLLSLVGEDSSQLGLRLDGRSLLTSRSDTVYAEESFNQFRRPLTKFNDSREINFIFAVRRSSLKYIRTYWFDGRIEEELYDLSTDPGESRNLIGASPNLDKMRELMNNHLEDIEFNFSKERLGFLVRKSKGYF